MMRVDRLVAFAGVFPHSFQIIDVNMSPPIGDHPLLLQIAGDSGNALYGARPSSPQGIPGLTEDRHQQDGAYEAATYRSASQHCGPRCKLPPVALAQKRIVRISSKAHGEQAAPKLTRTTDRTQ